MSAFIPEGYIPDIDQRMVAYRRLAKMTTVNEIADECSIDPYLLDGVLNFLTFSDVILEKENNRF